jgi:hypothetical protein
MTPVLWFEKKLVECNPLDPHGGSRRTGGVGVGVGGRRRDHFI